MVEWVGAVEEVLPVLAVEGVEELVRVEEQVVVKL